MSPCYLTISRPTTLRAPPALACLDVDGQQWHLSLSDYRELIVDITGIDPTDGVEYHDLVTITARLEGYVESRKRADRTDTPSDSADRTWYERLGRVVRERLKQLLAWVRNDTDSTPANERFDTVEEPTYPPATVYQLSRVFRAAVKDERRDIEQRINPGSAALAD